MDIYVGNICRVEVRTEYVEAILGIKKGPVPEFEFREIRSKAFSAAVLFCSCFPRSYRWCNTLVIEIDNQCVKCRKSMIQRDDRAQRKVQALRTDVMRESHSEPRVDGHMAGLGEKFNQAASERMSS